jgi:uncharacterized protein YcnI
MSSSHPTRHKLLAARRLAAAGALAAGLAAFTAGAAEAHVEVHPDTTAAGSVSQLSFRVPNESPKAGTVKVSVQLPQDKPFLEVSAKSLPGWKISVTTVPLPKPVESEGTTITKAVRTVTWTASDGAQVPPGQYQDFSISVGPLPAAGEEVVLPATQTYSDHTVVHWNEPTPASGEEPEHPAPAFEVTAAIETDHHGESATASPAGPASTPAAADPNTQQAAAARPDTTARWLGGIALVAALGAVALAAVGLRSGAKR